MVITFHYFIVQQYMNRLCLLNKILFLKIVSICVYYYVLVYKNGCLFVCSVCNSKT